MSLGKFLLQCASVAALLAGGGCAGNFEPLTPTADGYFDAIRFRRLVQVRDHGINIYTFNAGTVLIADRRTSYGVVYCGNASIAVKPFPTCLGFHPPRMIVIGPGGGFKQVERQLDPLDIEQIKFRP
jgi:hypothetical protein